MGQSVGSTGETLVMIFANLYLFIVILRFILQFSQADFYNPISQGIAKATSPIVNPLQKILKPIGKVSIAALVLAFAVKLTGIVLVLLMEHGGIPQDKNIFLGALAGVAMTFLDIYFFAMIGSVILSWLAPHSSHPGAMLIYQITEPAMSPVRKFIPPIGGLDLSPIFVFVGIMLLKNIVIGTLGVSSGLKLSLIAGL